jgi:hypothetical protein
MHRRDALPFVIKKAFRLNLRRLFLLVPEPESNPAARDLAFDSTGNPFK